MQDVEGQQRIDLQVIVQALHARHLNAPVKDEHVVCQVIRHLRPRLRMGLPVAAQQLGVHRRPVDDHRQRELDGNGEVRVCL